MFAVHTLSVSLPPTRVAAFICFSTVPFADDLAHVERRLGGEPVHVPHRNKSPHGSYRDYYTDATRAKIAEVYARDLEAFGNTF